MTKPELIKAEQYFFAIADRTTDMIHLNDSDGQIIYANQANETILGYPLNEFINTTAFDIIHPEDREIIGNDMLSLQEDSQLPSRDIRLLKKDGMYVDVEVRGFVVELDNKKHIGAIIRDISDRKKSEKELESYRGNLEKLVEERTKDLQMALDELKVLKGIFPICSFCKKIRDDEGYWNQVEEYISKHSEATFSHGLCPVCAEKHYPDFLKSDK